MNQEAQERPGGGREVWALAFPALFTLAAQPSFLLVDSLILARLGTGPLAAAAAALAIFLTLSGLMVFLMFSTTPTVAYAWGQGDRETAFRTIRDSVLSALLVSIPLGAVMWILAPVVIVWFASEASVADAGADYLRVVLLSLPATLMFLAINGAFRGFQDTMIPMIIVIGGFLLNAVLTLILVFPAGWGLLGSAWGWVIAQWIMVLAGLVVLWRRSRGVRLRGGTGRVGRLEMARAHWWLFLRTITLRCVLLGSVALAALSDTATLASYQLLFNIFSIVSMFFDALAVAAQALIGKEGALRTMEARRRYRTLVRSGFFMGLVVGAGTVLVAWTLAGLFSPDPVVTESLRWGMTFLGASVPLLSYVFVLDGVLIGMKRFRYLAFAGFVNLAAAGAWGVVVAVTLSADMVPHPWALVWIWTVWGGAFMILRAITLRLGVSRLLKEPQAGPQSSRI